MRREHTGPIKDEEGKMVTDDKEKAKCFLHTEKGGVY